MLQRSWIVTDQENTSRSNLTPVTGEYADVSQHEPSLMPCTRAWLAKEKGRKSGTSGEKTVEWYTWEISRLETLNGVLAAAKGVSISLF